MKHSQSWSGVALALGFAAVVAAQSPLSTIDPTITPSNNGGALGGAVYFDLTVNTSILINSIDSNFSDVAGAACSLEIWTTPTSHVGNEGNAAAWTLLGSGNGTTAGRDILTNITYAAPVQLQTGTNGYALVAVGAAHAYTNGTGTNQTFSNAEATIVLGSASNVPFVGTPFTPRVWNGSINYNPASGLFGSFSPSTRDAGPGEAVTFTDTSFTSDPGGILTVDWDIGNDGTIDGSGSPFTFTLPGGASACGPLDVRQVVTDANGSATNIEMGAITIGAPIASFTATPPGGPASAMNPLVVQFQDTSTGNPTTWSWDLDGDGVFGDGGGVPNPVFPYLTEGLTTVSLITSNACGMSNTATTTIDTRRALCTIDPTVTPSNNQGNVGGAIYFDVTVLNPMGITVTSIDTNMEGAGGLAGVGLDVFIRSGSHVGNESSMAGWTLIASDANATSNPFDQLTSVDVPDFPLQAGTFGVALVAIGVAHAYTNGTGTNQSFANADLQIDAGSATNVPFTGAPFTPRVWNGCIAYSQGAVGGSFTTAASGGCTNSSGGIASISGNPPAGGMNLNLTSSSAPAMTQGAFLLAASQTGGIPLGIIGAPGCLLHAGNVIASLNVMTDPTGTATATIPIAAGTPIGLTLFIQPVYVDIGQNALNVVTGDVGQAVIG